jgi:hypothetical protein
MSQQNTIAYMNGFADGKKVAAKELRRLHEVNEELLEALEEIANAYAPVSAPEAYLMQKARNAIAKATGESK